MTSWGKRIRTAGAAATAAALALSPVFAMAAEPGRRAARSTSSPPTVSVTGRGGAYRIDASFRVETHPSVAWAVLTDYDNLPSFVSSMRSSAAAREASGRLLVTQEAEGRVGLFSRTLYVVLDVTEQPPTRVAFRDVGGGSFHLYAGAWTISPEASGSRITYTLAARPRTSPPLFARSILASNTRGLLEQVGREMLRRGHTAHSGPGGLGEELPDRVGGR